MTIAQERASAVTQAQAYYDSADADAFYLQVWGGEDIHIGLYDPEGLSIRDASRNTVVAMADLLQGVGADTRVLDLGAGYGGAARYLAGRFGCRVVCLNLSETQNNRNRQLNDQAGLGDKIQVRHGDFEAIPESDSSFDVVWSQDAILHSGDRQRVLREAGRVLRPSGQLLFTDPMQAEGASAAALAPVLERIHLQSMGSFRFYDEALAALGFTPLRVIDKTAHLILHYSRVRETLLRRRRELGGQVSAAYVQRMLAGLQHWIDAGSAGNLAWGIMHYRGPQ